MPHRPDTFIGPGSVPTETGTKRRLRLGTLDLDHPADLKAALQWTERTLSLLREGGTWGIPADGSVYRFFRSRMQTERTGPESPAISFVLAQLGWTVMPAP